MQEIDYHVYTWLTVSNVDSFAVVNINESGFLIAFAVSNLHDKQTRAGLLITRHLSSFAMKTFFYLISKNHISPPRN